MQRLWTAAGQRASNWYSFVADYIEHSDREVARLTAALAASEQRAAEATARAERTEAERNEAYELSEQWNEMALDNFDRATTARADGIRAAAEVCEKYGSDGVLRHPLAMRDAVLSLLADGADGKVR
jgi:hypothetical protein